MQLSLSPSQPLVPPLHNRWPLPPLGRKPRPPLHPPTPHHIPGRSTSPHFSASPPASAPPQLFSEYSTPRKSVLGLPFHLLLDTLNLFASSGAGELAMAYPGANAELVLTCVRR